MSNHFRAGDLANVLFTHVHQSRETSIYSGGAVVLTHWLQDQKHQKPMYHRPGFDAYDPMTSVQLLASWANNEYHDTVAVHWVSSTRSWVYKLTRPCSVASTFCFPELAHNFYDGFIAQTKDSKIA